LTAYNVAGAHSHAARRSKSSSQNDLSFKYSENTLKSKGFNSTLCGDVRWRVDPASLQHVIDPINGAAPDNQPQLDPLCEPFKFTAFRETIAYCLPQQIPVTPTSRL
jgi:hypothetical protein